MSAFSLLNAVAAEIKISLNIEINKLMFKKMRVEDNSQKEVRIIEFDIATGSKFCADFKLMDIRRAFRVVAHFCKYGRRRTLMSINYTGKFKPFAHFPGN